MNEMMSQMRKTDQVGVLNVFEKRRLQNALHCVVWSCVVLSVLCCGWNESIAQEKSLVNKGLEDERVVLMPVQYSSSANDEPLVAAYIKDLETGLKRSWSGEVYTGDRLSELVRKSWVDPLDTAALSLLETKVEKGTKLFYGSSPSDAIPVLEEVVDRADVLLGQVSGDPKRAALLLKAHLLLWWSFKQVGEEARLGPLMAQTVERFPAAVVSSIEMSPQVAEAFNAAREKQRETGVALTVVLESTVGGNCGIWIDGFQHGDARTAGISVRPGRTYYITGGCDGKMLPPRRVVVNGPTMVHLDNILTLKMKKKGIGPTLWLAGGQASVADLAETGTAVGELLQSGSIVLAGVFMTGDGPVLQLDNIAVGNGVRACSVRLELSRSTTPGDIDAAVRAVVLRKPVEGRLTFRGYDQGEYREPKEYMDHVLGDGVQRIFTWVSLGLSVGALGTGVAMDFVAQSSQDDLDVCVSQPSCRGTAKAESLRGDLNDVLVTRDVFYVTSGIMLGAAVAFYFIESPSLGELPASGPEARLGDPSEVQWGVFPAVSAEELGLGLEVRF